jgi:hypothetical protein
LEDDGVTESYDIHKGIVASGLRKSLYFEKLFKGEASFREKTSGTVRVELPRWKADAFPLLLDYQYKLCWSSTLHLRMFCQCTIWQTTLTFLLSERRRNTSERKT